MDVAEDLAWYEVNFGALIQMFEDRLPGIREALDRGGDMYPLEEFLPEGQPSQTVD